MISAPSIGVSAAVREAADGGCAPVRVSAGWPRYLATSGPLADGERAFIPIGLNLCFPRSASSGEEGLARYARWFDALAANGGNFVRIWLGHSFFDVEPARAGVFDESAARRIDAVLDMAHERGLRAKLTLDHFRTISPRAEKEMFPGAAQFSKPAYGRGGGGFADDMAGFLESAECRRGHLRKIDWLAARYAGHPAVLAIELWNEMDAVAAPFPGVLDWTRFMLREVRRRFPDRLVMQSLGSLDRPRQYERYAAYARLRGSDVVQVHRYADPGAPDPMCHAPMDVLCADATRAMLRLAGSPGRGDFPGRLPAGSMEEEIEAIMIAAESEAAPAPVKPVILAECGAVESGHAAPSHLYEKDSEGTLLHDQLFAPFFAGAAGPGQAWHWDFYVERHALWWHFARFARAIEGFDPVAERAEPVFFEAPPLRVYALRGQSRALIWCRDSRCDWRAELVGGVAPEPVGNMRLPLASAGGPGERMSWTEARWYDPWTDRWTPVTLEAGEAVLPTFRRSGVLVLGGASPG